MIARVRLSENDPPAAKEAKSKAVPVPSGDTAGDRNPSTGRFVAGNTAARGLNQQHIQALKNATITCATEKDVSNVMAVILKRALAGDMLAARLWLDRTCGKIVEIADEPPEDDTPQFSQFR